MIIGIPLRTLAAALVALALAGPPAQAVENDPPVFRGTNGQFTLLRPAERPRLTPILTATGEAIDLSRFRGKVVLLNFWATWCGPCIREIPSLDRLQGEMGGESFEVVAVSIDRQGLDVVAPFFKRFGLRHLAIYLDPEQRTGYLNAPHGEGGAFPLFGLPISFVLDREGRVMGYLPGAADWTSPGAKALLRYYLARGRADGTN